MSAMSHRYKALGPLKNFASAAIWWIASIGLFVGVWEFCWYMMTQRRKSTGEN